MEAKNFIQKSTKLEYQNDNLKHIKPWSEISELQWFESLGELPPMRHRSIREFTFFFCSEAHTSNIHSCYCCVNGKYFSAKRRLTASYEEMIEELKGKL